MRRWRLIDSGPCPAHYNMALDEALAESVRAGASPPVLRLYGWQSASVSLGRFQQAGRLDLGMCEAGGVPVVRRPTGGRGILHGDELTYSVSAPLLDGPFFGGLLQSYRVLAGAFLGAFRSLGLDAAMKRDRRSAPSGSALCFQSASYGEISVDGRKIIGSAQKRWPDGMLQQGSIPLSLDREGMRAVFGEDATTAMAGLREYAPGIDVGAVKAAVREAFEEAFSEGLEESRPTGKEEARARELLREKYLLPGWTLRR